MPLALEKRMSILILKLFVFWWHMTHEPEKFGGLCPSIANTHKEDVSNMPGNINTLENKNQIK